MSSIQFFWKGGIENMGKEMKTYEVLLAAEGELNLGESDSSVLNGCLLIAIRQLRISIARTLGQS